jgi:hypothetical protein
VATVTVKNVGTQALTNVGITVATLGGRSAPLPARWTRLRTFRSETLTLRFPAAGAPGQKVALRITGNYKGGTFGGSLRLTLP